MTMIDLIVSTSSRAELAKMLFETEKMRQKLQESRDDLLTALRGMLDAFPPPKIRSDNGMKGNLAHAAARTAIANAEKL